MRIQPHVQAKWYNCRDSKVEIQKIGERGVEHG
jgi:hypothetical protein